MVSNCGGTYVGRDGDVPDHDDWEDMDIKCKQCGKKFTFWLPLRHYLKWKSGECSFICKGCIPNDAERTKVIKKLDEEWRRTQVRR